MVTGDRDEAVAAVGRDEPVVLILAPDGPIVPAPAGRVAVLVGDPGDPATWSAASAMERELFPSGTTPPRTAG